ncbi:uncharacterized protein [Clytia hemisphaerica]|uniref:Cnidarian restricted protein n=1 Tax=Clytia hemisphaerica TaxID=252671 RepID=A0A7M5XAB3_9CNID
MGQIPWKMVFLKLFVCFSISVGISRASSIRLTNGLNYIPSGNTAILSWIHDQPFDMVEFNYRLNQSEPLLNKIEYRRNQSSGQFDTSSTRPNITERLFTSSTADNSTFEISLRDVQPGEYLDAKISIGGSIFGIDYRLIGYLPPALLSYQFTDDNKFIAEIQTDLQPNVQITQISPTEQKQFVYTSNLDDRHVYTTDYTAPYPCGRKIKINATIHRSEMVKIIDFPNDFEIYNLNLTTNITCFSLKWEHSVSNCTYQSLQIISPLNGSAILNLPTDQSYFEQCSDKPIGWVWNYDRVVEGKIRGVFDDGLYSKWYKFIKYSREPCGQDDPPSAPDAWYSVLAGVGSVVTVVLIFCIISHCILVTKKSEAIKYAAVKSNGRATTENTETINLIVAEEGVDSADNKPSSKGDTLFINLESDENTNLPSKEKKAKTPEEQIPQINFEDENGCLMSIREVPEPEEEPNHSQKNDHDPSQEIIKDRAKSEDIQNEKSKIDEDNDIIAETPNSNEKDLLIDEPLQEKQDSKSDKQNIDKPLNNYENASVTKPKPEENVSLKPLETVQNQKPESQGVKNNKPSETNEPSAQPVHKNTDPDSSKTPEAEAKTDNGENLNDISGKKETIEKTDQNERQNIESPKDDTKIEVLQNVQSDTTV